MSAQGTAPQGRDAQAARAHRTPGDVAYRRAWWSLALYPVTFVAAFVIGEGLITVLTGDSQNPSFWQVLVAATPALVVFVVPGILAVVQGRKAMRLGRRDGMTPAIVGAAIGLGFVGLNLASGLLQLIFA